MKHGMQMLGGDRMLLGREGHKQEAQIPNRISSTGPQSLSPPPTGHVTRHQPPGSASHQLKMDVSRHLLGQLSLPQQGLGKMPRFCFSWSPHALPCPSICRGQHGCGQRARSAQEHTPGPGAGRGHVGGQGLPGSLWRSTMCFDNCHHSYSFRDSTQGPSQTKKPPN